MTSDELRELAKRGEDAAGAFIQWDWTQKTVNVHEWYRREIAQLAVGLRAAADRIDTLEATLADANRTMVELQPDPILVEDSWIPVSELPTVCGNFMRSSAEYARLGIALLIERDEARARLAEAEATLAKVREWNRIEDRSQDGARKVVFNGLEAILTARVTEGGKNNG